MSRLIKFDLEQKYSSDFQKISSSVGIEFNDLYQGDYDNPNNQFKYGDERRVERASLSIDTSTGYEGAVLSLEGLHAKEFGIDKIDIYLSKINLVILKKAIESIEYVHLQEEKEYREKLKK